MMIDWLCEAGIPRWQVGVVMLCAVFGTWLLCWWLWRRHRERIRLFKQAYDPVTKTWSTPVRFDGI